MDLSYPEHEVLRDNDRLVRRAISDMRRRWPSYRHIPTADLMQAGRLGMLKGIRQFDRSRGSNLESFVYGCILWEIAHEYGKKLFRDPIWRAWPIRDAIDPFDPFGRVEDNDNRDLAVKLVHDALEELGNDDRGHRFVTALCLRNGIGTDAHTLSDIGKVLGVTPERVRQICFRAEDAIKNTKVFLPQRKREWKEMKDRRDAEIASQARMRLAGDRLNA